MANNQGTVIQVMGPVLDIRFADDQLPKLLSAILVKNGDSTITAEVAQLDFGMMQHIVDRITHEVSGVNRVLWDLTPKPTGTIEWE